MAGANQARPKRRVGAGECRVRQERDGAQVGLRASGGDIRPEARRAADRVVGHSADRAAGDRIADDGERVAGARERGGGGDRRAGEERAGQKRNGVGVGLRACGGDRSGERRDAAIGGGKIADPGKRSVDRSRAAEVERQIVAAANQARPKRWVGADEFCIG